MEVVYAYVYHSLSRLNIFSSLLKMYYSMIFSIPTSFVLNQTGNINNPTLYDYLILHNMCMQLRILKNLFYLFIIFLKI